jgi:hypothetical protein
VAGERENDGQQRQHCPNNHGEQHQKRDGSRGESDLIEEGHRGAHKARQGAGGVGTSRVSARRLA